MHRSAKKADSIELRKCSSADQEVIHAVVVTFLMLTDKL